MPISEGIVLDLKKNSESRKKIASMTSKKNAFSMPRQVIHKIESLSKNQSRNDKASPPQKHLNLNDRSEIYPIYLKLEDKFKIGMSSNNTHTNV
jgi:hypothetical protein